MVSWSFKKGYIDHRKMLQIGNVNKSRATQRVVVEMTKKLTKGNLKRPLGLEKKLKGQDNTIM